MINKVLVIDRKKVMVRVGMGVGMIMAIMGLYGIISNQAVVRKEIFCRIERVNYQTASNLCSATGGKTQFEYVSKWRRNGYALVLTTNKIIADAETSGVDIKTVLGEIDLEVISPTIMVAKIEKDMAERLGGKFNISGIYYDRVDLNLVTDASDIEWLNTWNSDGQQLTGCVCPEATTWDCSGGCKEIDEDICDKGGGQWQWWKQNCKCPEGETWYFNLGRCEDVTIE